MHLGAAGREFAHFARPRAGTPRARHRVMTRDTRLFLLAHLVLVMLASLGS